MIPEIIDFFERMFDRTDVRVFVQSSKVGLTNHR